MSMFEVWDCDTETKLIDLPAVDLEAAIKLAKLMYPTSKLLVTSKPKGDV